MLFEHSNIKNSIKVQNRHSINHSFYHSTHSLPVNHLTPPSTLTSLLSHLVEFLYPCPLKYPNIKLSTISQTQHPLFSHPTHPHFNQYTSSSNPLTSSTLLTNTSIYNTLIQTRLKPTQRRNLNLRMKALQQSQHSARIKMDIQFTCQPWRINQSSLIYKDKAPTFPAPFLSNPSS